MSDDTILEILKNNREKDQLYISNVRGNTIIIKSRNNPDFMLRLNINKNNQEIKEKILRMFQEIWIAVESTNPNYPVGTTIIPSKDLSKIQHYININTFKESYVKWEFLCYRWDLENDPDKKVEINEKVNKIKEQGR